MKENTELEHSVFARNALSKEIGIGHISCVKLNEMKQNKN